METTRICPSCKKPLPADVPMGLCPECLVKAGFSTEPGSGGDKGFVPPPVAEMAKLFPQFEILDLIGKGGMGAVYKARQPGLDRLVALKILAPHVADDPGFVERFNREARALARLSHPNIVAVHEFGKVGESLGAPPSEGASKPEAGKTPIPLCYLLMEFVDGMNLREVERAGRLTPQQTLQLVPQICDALQFAHNEGVVHRDIKPENILLDKKGRVKITDFGIAKMIGATPEKVGLTGMKDIVGTPHYMAPEQVERPNTVDHRADIYSLGVVFYELLTGELPIGKFASPSSKVQVDVRLDDVVLRALEKEPERRYQQASQVKTDVETIAGTPPEYPSTKKLSMPVNPQSQPGSGSAPPIASARCSRTAIVGAVWAVFFVFVFLSWFWFRGQVSPNPEPGRPSWWLVGVGIVLLPLGFLSPFGTTILGWIAVGQIRRSAGRLYGMGLAVFDGLCFPLLFLDALIAWVWVLISKLAHSLLVGNGGLQGLSPTGKFFIEHDTEITMLLILTTSVVVDVLIFWLVYRAAKKPLASSTEQPAPRRSVWVGIAIASAMLVGAVLVGGIVLIVLFVPQRRTVQSTALTPALPEIKSANSNPPRQQAKAEPQELSEREVRDIIIDLKSPSTPRQQVAASRLVFAKPGARRDEIETLLLGMLNDSEWPARRAAAAALGVLGTENAFEPLVKALDDSNMSVRWAAIQALAKTKDARAATPLAKHMSNQEDRLQITQALQSLGAPAEGEAIDLLQSKDPQARYAACRILKEIGTEKSEAALTTAASDADGIVAMLAKDALKNIDARRAVTIERSPQPEPQKREIQ